MALKIEFLVSNLANPTLLFFLLGWFAAWIKSDLEIPAPSVKFISLYLLFSIGFKGGHEIAISVLTYEMLYVAIYGLAASILIPLVLFFLCKRRLGDQNAAAIAACYGSVSAVTFVTAASFLDAMNVRYSGYMVAVMALMEAPAIVIALLLLRRFGSGNSDSGSLFRSLGHSLTNGSVVLIVGSLLIGVFADAKQAEGIRPFTTDIFKGFLAIFLLEMGMVTARRISALKGHGVFLGSVGILIPLLAGVLTAHASGFFVSSPGDRLILAVLCASASYIAVPAAAKIAFPRADPGIFIPMALGVTFPFNIAIGIPLYYAVIQS